MRNPLRRLGTSVRRLLGRPSAASAADGPRSQAPAEGAARPADVPALAVDIVRREFAALAGKLQKEVGRRHERLQIALAEFREFAALVETTVKTQLKGMAGEITQLRRDVKAHLERAERRAEPLETSLASIHQRTAELQLGIEKLAEAFDHQLSRTESGLQALR
ncbi:MAG: hypothetical protein JXA90_13870, partial [Planctomycetes bacterium]|nr:hypothetical protein [Planctomycetota bacterium]